MRKTVVICDLCQSNLSNEKQYYQIYVAKKEPKYRKGTLLLDICRSCFITKESLVIKMAKKHKFF